MVTALNTRTHHKIKLACWKRTEDRAPSLDPVLGVLSHCWYRSPSSWWRWATEAPSVACLPRVLPLLFLLFWNIQVMKDSAPELNVSSSETEEDKEEAKPDGEKDPDFNQVRVEAAFPCHTCCCSGRAAPCWPQTPLRVLWGVLVLDSLPHLFSSLGFGGAC